MHLVMYLDTITKAQCLFKTIYVYISYCTIIDASHISILYKKQDKYEVQITPNF